MEIKRLILILLFLGCFHPAFGQWFIGNDVGFLSYDVRDELVSPNRYEKITPGLLNLGLYYSGNLNKLAVRYGSVTTKMKPAQDLQTSKTNYLEDQNFELDIEYFRKCASFSRNMNMYIGAGYNGHFSYYDHVFESDFITGSQDAHEMAMINISINGLLQYKIKKHLFQYKAGLSLYNYGSRPQNLQTGGEFSMSGFGFRDYIHLQNSLTGFIHLSKRFDLKPEYRLRYYTYTKPNQLKILKQSFLVGIYFRLW